MLLAWLRKFSKSVGTGIPMVFAGWSRSAPPRIFIFAALFGKKY